MDRYIEEVYSKVNIEEGENVIEHFLLEVYMNKVSSNKNLSRSLQLPIPVVTAIKKEFINLGILEQNNGIRCTDKGIEYAENVLGYRGLDYNFYMKVVEDRYVIEEDFVEELEIIQQYLDERPTVDVEIDQSKCMPRTSLKRAILALKYKTLIGKRVLCVGDDDLVSIAIWIVLKKLYDKIENIKTNIEIIDVDDRILNYIDQIALKEKASIKCYNVNLRQPIDNIIDDRYDCFFTDPPYTMEGMILFLSRGISVLNKKVGLPIFFSFAHKSPDFTYNMQKQFIDMGLIIDDIIPCFNEYEGASIIGNVGQMIVLKTTNNTKPLIIDEYDDIMYTNEFKRTIRTYQCKKCKEKIKVGYKENIKNIEKLKIQGCPNCNNVSFDLIGKEFL